MKKFPYLKPGPFGNPIFPIDALVVWCPTWSKNLGRSLGPNQPNLFLSPCSITECVTRISFSHATHYITKAQRVQLLYHRVFNLRAEGTPLIDLHLIFENQVWLDELIFFFYFELDFCRLHRQSSQVRNRQKRLFIQNFFLKIKYRSILGQSS